MLLPILDRITPIPESRFYEDGTRRVPIEDPSYVEFTYQWVGGNRSTVGFFRQWNQIWYRHERDCS